MRQNVAIIAQVLYFDSLKEFLMYFLIYRLKINFKPNSMTPCWFTVGGGGAQKIWDVNNFKIVL